MHDKVIGAGDERAATIAEQDARDEAAVLRDVLFIYPEAFTFEELVREETVASADRVTRERVERAVRDLTAGGLLHRVGDLVLPTRAAVNAHVLFEL